MGSLQRDLSETIFSQQETLIKILNNFNTLHNTPQAENDSPFPTTLTTKLLESANSVADIWKLLARLSITIQQKNFIIQDGINTILTHYQKIIPYVQQQVDYLEELSEHIPWKKNIVEIKIQKKTCNQFQYTLQNLKDWTNIFNRAIISTINNCKDNSCNISTNFLDSLENATNPLANICISLATCKAYLSQMENKNCSLIDSYPPQLVIEIKKHHAIVKFLESCFNDIDTYHRNLKKYMHKCIVTYKIPINQSLKFFKASHSEHQSLASMIAEDKANEEKNLEKYTPCTIS